MKKKYLLAAILIIVALLVGAGGVKFYDQKHPKVVIKDIATIPTPLPSCQQKITTAYNLSKMELKTEWKNYFSFSHCFSIKYPLKVQWMEGEWNSIVNVNEVFFGPPISKPGGYVWDIFVYDKKEKNIEDIIKYDGSQFNDRQEKRENILINNYPAILVTVTTPSHQDWVSKFVLIEKEGWIFSIGNGARDRSEFSTFYNSLIFY